MVYLDYNATTPVLASVRDAMRSYLDDEYGNASSAHRFGARARAAVEAARRSVSAAIGAQASEIVFTSGGTEGNNLALFGALGRQGRPHVVAAPIEHSSVIAPLRALGQRGAAITWLPTDDRGRLDPDAVGAALTPATTLVTVGWANNEIGTVQAIAAMAAICRAHGVMLHVDAVQAFGKIPVAVEGIDLCTVSAHKIGGPKGVGALYVRRGVTLVPLLFGGSQERGVRPGSENVAGIVGFGVAAAAIGLQHAGRVRALRERLWRGLEACGDVRRNSPVEACLPNTLHVSFHGASGETMVAALDLEGVAVSAGSACTAGAAEPSHVLRAIGHSESEAREGVRFSLGAATTEDDIVDTIGAVRRVVQRIRGIDQQVAVHA